MSGSVDPNRSTTPDQSNAGTASNTVASRTVAENSASGNRATNDSGIVANPLANDDGVKPGQSRPAEQPTVEPPANRRGRQTNAAVGFPIHLSVGTKLPVSLPGGTQMAFTAEYHFVGGQAPGRMRYVWVIEGRGGKRESVPISKLGTRGKLPNVFSRKLRPGDEPFRSYIEAWPLSSGKQKRGAGRRVSNVVPMS